MKLLEMKNTMPGKNRLDTTEEKIDKLEDTAIETSNNETEKKMDRKKQDMHVLGGFKLTCNRSP